MPTERLEAEIQQLAKQLTTGTATLLELIGEFDVRGSWSLFGSLSCAAWLADVCDIEISTARTQVRIARAMRRHPQLHDAVTSRSISYAKARVLAPHFDVDIEPEVAAELLAIAERTPAGRLGAAIAAWSNRNEDQDAIDDRHHRERHVSWRTDSDGMVRITARLVPSDAAVICAIVDQQVMRADAPAGASLGQQRSDALLAVITGSGVEDGHRRGPRLHEPAREGDIRAPHPGQVGDPDPDHRPRTGHDPGTEGSPDPVQMADREHRGPKRAGTSPVVVTEVVVHVRPDGNALADGTPLTDNAVTALLPGAFVSLLMKDARGRAIDASPRRRYPTRRQKRVIDERHPTCGHPGCGARLFLEYDHVQPYARGGPTTIDNLQRLCGRHNRAKARADGLL